MPQIAVNSTHIATFGFSAAINLQNRSVLFDASSTVYNGGGISAVHGIAFSMIDSAGIELAGVDWTNPQIVPSTSQTYLLDLSYLPINFLFQNYQIIGYIQDADGSVYATIPVLKTVCQPTGINEGGYVDGTFTVTPDCLNNILTVKELTLLVYNNLTPLTISKSGTLYYPTGTISPISFTNTPWNNNVVRTGTYRVTCTTTATYDLLDSISIIVSYYTDHEFPVTCSNFLGDITCCLTGVYNTYLANCGNAVGQAALQKYNSVLPSILNGLVKQFSGQDASIEVGQVKDALNCDCSSSSALQNEATPINPAIYSIVLQGQGATTVLPAYIIGSTKVYNIASSAYSVGKGDTGDLAYAITVDASVPNAVKYLITFNYDVQAGYNLNAISNDPTLLNQLKTLAGSMGSDITGLDGKCVINLTESNYAVSQSITGSTVISNIVINGTNYAAPTNLFATNTTAVASWLNSLTLGTFTAVVASNVITIQTVSNINTVSTITFGAPSIIKMFSATNATLVQVLQAVVNYLCGLTDLQNKLSSSINLCTLDYNGNEVITQTPAGSTQAQYNTNVASSICNLAGRISTLTSITCATMQGLFTDKPAISFGASDRLYGTLGGNCASLTDQQIANLVIAAINKYSDVKLNFCAISCTSTPTCPDVSNTNLAMSGSNIGVYGLTWISTPIASQTVSVKYRITGTLTWTTATNSLLILPNGNISGTTPYVITGVSMGTSYDILIQNNCGGSGFIKSLTTPTGSVYTGRYLLDNIIYNICGESLVTLYSSQPFGSGTTMYSNIGLTTPVTGYTFITTAGADIFQINTSTGIVGIDTGSACSNGTAGSYTLGNSTGTICGLTPVTLYTNGAFAVGQVIYTDSALSNPQTGFSYVVANGYIFTVNSATGAITGTTGLSCLNYTLSPQYNFSFTSVTGTGVPTLPPTGTSGNVYGHHGAISGSLSITISGTIVTPSKIDVLVNGTVFSCAPITGSGTYYLACTALVTDNVTVAIDSGTC